MGRMLSPFGGGYSWVYCHVLMIRCLIFTFGRGGLQGFPWSWVASTPNHSLFLDFSWLSGRHTFDNIAWQWMLAFSHKVQSSCHSYGIRLDFIWNCVQCYAYTLIPGNCAIMQGYSIFHPLILSSWRSLEFQKGDTTIPVPSIMVGVSWIFCL